MYPRLGVVELLPIDTDPSDGYDVALSDPLVAVDTDPIALTPTTISTIDTGATPWPVITPESANQAPQILPTLVGAALPVPTSAGGGLLLLALLALGIWGVKRGGGDRSY